jgi:hypothetical protein
MLASCHYDKIPEENNLKEERFIMVSKISFHGHLLASDASGFVRRLNMRGQCMW